MTDKALLAKVVDLLDQVVSPLVADRALRRTGLRREVFGGEPGFLPLSLEVVLVDAAARIAGEKHLGLILGAAHPHAALGCYSSYVTSAPCLFAALLRGQRALHFLQPGCRVGFRDVGTHIVLCYDTGLHTLNGAHHVHESLPLILSDLVRQFAGPTWVPDWIEVPGARAPADDLLERHVGAPVHPGAALPGLALRKADLGLLNPSPPDAGALVRFQDLPRLTGLVPAQRLAEQVADVLKTQILLGDSEAETVAMRLSLGVRTLERRLQAEGTSFRRLKQQVLQDRACTLLATTPMSVEAIALKLGYREPNSFRRAFRGWTGRSPLAYAAALRQSAVPA